MMEACILVLLFAAVIAVWALICNEKTYRQRMDALDFACDKGHAISTSIDLMHLLRDVPYVKHLFYLVTFRDPRKIYPKELDNSF